MHKQAPPYGTEVLVKNNKDSEWLSNRYSTERKDDNGFLITYMKTDRHGKAVGHWRYWKPIEDQDEQEKEMTKPPLPPYGARVFVTNDLNHVMVERFSSGRLDEDGRLQTHKCKESGVGTGFWKYWFLAEKKGAQEKPFQKGEELWFWNDDPARAQRLWFCADATPHCGTVFNPWLSCNKYGIRSFWINCSREDPRPTIVPVVGERYRMKHLRSELLSTSTILYIDDKFVVSQYSKDMLPVVRWLDDIEFIKQVS